MIIANQSTFINCQPPDLCCILRPLLFLCAHTQRAIPRKARHEFSREKQSQLSGDPVVPYTCHGGPLSSHHHDLGVQLRLRV